MGDYTCPTICDHDDNKLVNTPGGDKTCAELKTACSASCKPDNPIWMSDSSQTNRARGLCTQIINILETDCGCSHGGIASQVEHAAQQVIAQQVNAAENSGSECAASYNGGRTPAPVCCGQEPDSAGVTDEKYICPATQPSCVWYIYRQNWGTCTGSSGPTDNNGATDNNGNGGSSGGSSGKKCSDHQCSSFTKKLKNGAKNITGDTDDICCQEKTIEDYLFWILLVVMIVILIVALI